VKPVDLVDDSVVKHLSETGSIEKIFVSEWIRLRQRTSSQSWNSSVRHKPKD